MSEKVKSENFKRYLTEEEFRSMTKIQNTYEEDLSKYEYVVRFGNAYFGYACSKDMLRKVWHDCIIHSMQQYPGDISLHYKGKIIRAMNNAEVKILTKDVRYPYYVRKWEYKN